MVNLNSLFQSIPQLGTSLISSAYEKYQQWVGKTEIPAFQCEDTSMVFRHGRILLNCDDVESLLDGSRSHMDMNFWLGMSEKLKAYRSWYFKQVRARKKADDITSDDIVDLEADAIEFEQTMQYLMAKIYRKVKRRYDETTDGLAFHLDEEGELTINGVKINAFLDMATRYPTEKARTFLKGLKSRLVVILSNRNGNPNYDKIRESSQEVFAEIDRLLGHRQQLLSDVRA